MPYTAERQNRDSALMEYEIMGMSNEAFAQNQFQVYYQPQYNHSTGMMIGAEALVRWIHPVRGIIPPNEFIAVFERQGKITELDLYVFDKVCAFVRRCIDENFSLVPVSVNITRQDVYSPEFVEKLERIRANYEVPAKYLRFEITESSAFGSVEYVNMIIKKLHNAGYIVEMDDFGSGYSSLNVLKDLDVDVIKMDLAFLQGNLGGRGGTIVSSVVNMAKWLNMPVIAEGVETVEQADFMRSIGCDYIQGYLYSRPLPQNDFEKLLSGSSVGVAVPQMKLIDMLNAGHFWDPESQETLIFSNFVGGAAIFSYHKGNVDILRVNPKYLKELGMNMSEKETIMQNPWSQFTPENRAIYEEMLQRAIETGDEQECEVWRSVCSRCCGSESMCVRSTVRMIGKSGDRTLFYATVRNVTAEKRQMQSILDSERRFKAASEQANIYFWEYTVATKEMRPCFRCMRDLGLPAVVRNYPEPAFEAGIFPMDMADLYRDWHKQIAAGVKNLEGVFPLTVARVPFIVRYTTEFDENGRPVKAYGSATLVVDENPQ
ncbi:MAG TPA: EAL domain-containing protein [Methanocorpusculum sp.]|nr:EAL domain-containing protein [Methanocorpusculum sp.]